LSRGLSTGPASAKGMSHGRLARDARSPLVARNLARELQHADTDRASIHSSPSRPITAMAIGNHSANPPIPPMSSSRNAPTSTRASTTPMTLAQGSASPYRALQYAPQRNAARIRGAYASSAAKSASHGGVPPVTQGTCEPEAVSSPSKPAPASATATLPRSPPSLASLRTAFRRSPDSCLLAVVQAVARRSARARGEALPPKASSAFSPLGTPAFQRSKAMEEVMALQR